MNHAANTTPAPDKVITAISPGDERGARVKPLDWQLSARIVKWMIKHPRTLSLVIFLAIFIAGLNVAIPYVLTETIRGPIGDPSLFEDNFWGLDAVSGQLIGVSLIVIMALAWYILMRTRQYAVTVLGEKVVRDMRTAVFSHLQALGMDFYDHTKVGRIVARGTSDIIAIRAAVMHVGPRMIIAILQMSSALTLMLFSYDIMLGAIVLAIAPILYIVNWKFRKMLSQSYRGTQESYSIMTANLAESILGMRVTQAFAREKINSEMFRGLCEMHKDRHMIVARAHGLYIPMLDIASQLFIAVALIVGTYRVQQQAMTVGDLLGFMVMTGVFFQPITVIGDMYNTTLQAMAGAERVFRLLDTVPAKLDPNPENAVNLPDTSEGMLIEFNDVTFGYSPDKPILKNVTFTVPPGSTVALVGHTGSGKTSIVNLAAKFYRHDTNLAQFPGIIKIDGINIENISQKDLHKQTGVVLQENILFSGTVLDNIRFGQPQATDDDVHRVCSDLGCLDVLELLPQGLYTEVGERGESLSLGQRQLICFARAMIAKPRLLIFDEATSSVDTVTEAKVQKALAKLLEGRTSFVIAHRLSTIRSADMILVIDKGKVIEHGTHEQLLSAAGTYCDLHAEFVRISQGEDSLL